MSQDVFIKGETIELEAEFKDQNGDLTDPSTPVEISILLPDDAVGSPSVDNTTVKKDSEGLFIYTYTTTKVGKHKYKFESADGLIDIDFFEVYEDEIG